MVFATTVGLLVNDEVSHAPFLRAHTAGTASDTGEVRLCFPPDVSSACSLNSRLAIRVCGDDEPEKVGREDALPRREPLLNSFHAEVITSVWFEFLAGSPARFQVGGLVGWTDTRVPSFGASGRNCVSTCWIPSSIGNNWWANGRILRLRVVTCTLLRRLAM